MEKDRFLLIKELFLAAQALPKEERRRWLEENCEEPSVRSAVEQLFAAHEQESTVLETPAYEMVGLRQTSDDNLIGSTIGTFRIEGVIGQGGMGVVYRAAQESPRREVALKLIRGEVDSERIQRLELEAQALALLRHPGIVPIYERGRTSDGSPWFAMEYVDGERLDAYVSEHSVSKDARLQLFLELCDAVTHAHLKGVIHRDLKPANVLVCDRQTRAGSSGSQVGAVRVLDFGLARLTGLDHTLGGSLTEPGTVLGTLTYMSPEQARAEDVDQRADVYALAAILYELLTGKKPFDLAGCWMLEAVQRIVTDEPVRPCALQPDLERDLETIVRKGMEKSLVRRYQSVAALAGDVERFMRNLPILAHPPSTLYQLRKLVSRHRAMSASLAVVLFALLLSGVSFAWLKANHVSALKQERDTARSVVRFQSRLFAAEGIGGDRDVKVVRLVDEAARKVEVAFRDRPLIEAEVRDTLGGTYSGLGLYREAEPHLERALAVRRDLLGNDHITTMTTRIRVANLMSDFGRHQDAEDALRGLLADQERRLGPDHLESIKTRISLAAVISYLDKNEEAERLYRAALGELRERFAEDHYLILKARAQLAVIVRLRGDAVESMRMLRELLPELRATCGDDSEVALSAAHSLIVALKSLGRIDESVQLERDLLASRIEVLGEDHPVVHMTRTQLATLLISLGKLGEAEEIVRATLAHQEATLGRGHDHTVSTLTTLGMLLVRSGKPKEAEPILREVLDRHTAKSGTDSTDTLNATFNFAQLLSRLGRAEEGLALCRQNLTAFQRVEGPDHPDAIRAADSLGTMLYGMERFEEAAETLADVLAQSDQALGEGHPRSQWCRYNLAMCLRELDRLEEASILFEELLFLPEGTITEEHGFPHMVTCSYGRTLFALGRLNEAEEQLERGLAGMRERLGNDHPWPKGVESTLEQLRAERRSAADPPESDDG